MFCFFREKRGGKKTVNQSQQRLSFISWNKNKIMSSNRNNNNRNSRNNKNNVNMNLGKWTCM